MDPLVEKTMDAYGYVHQNPIRLIDPDGRSAAQSDWIPQIDSKGNITYVAETGASAESMAAQFNLKPEEAEAITGTKGSEEIQKGTRISGEKVKEVTGSEVLKLDVSNKTVTDQDIVFQTFFAFRRERFLDSQSSNPDFSGNVNDYFQNHKKVASANADGAFYGLFTDARKPTNLLIGGQRVSVHVSFSAVNDGGFSTFESRISNLGNGNYNINFLHPSAYMSDRIQRNTVPALNIITNNPSVLLDYLKFK